MKSIYLLGTKLKVFLIELPLIFLLILSIIYNGNAKNPGKLYPLIITLSLGIVFIFIYFLRLVRIKTEEVRCLGLFSSKDSIALKKDRRLVITVKAHGRLLVEVFGTGEAPLLDWVDPEDYLDKEINLFRSRAIGTERAARRIMKYFGIPKSDFKEIFKTEAFTKEYETVILTTGDAPLGKEFSLKFTETI